MAGGSGTGATGSFAKFGSMNASSGTGIAGGLEDQPGWTPLAVQYHGQLHLYPGGSINFYKNSQNNGGAVVEQSAKLPKGYVFTPPLA